MWHLSNPQAQRSLKVLTWTACAGAGMISVFFSEFGEIEGFEGKDHIFTDVRRHARDFIDRSIYGFDPESIRLERQKQQVAATKPMESGEK